MEQTIDGIVSKILGSEELTSEITQRLIGQAKEAAEKISDMTRREKCYKDLSLALAKQGFFKHALSIVDQIQGPEYRCYVLSVLVSQMSAKRNYSQAFELILQIDDEAYKEDALGYLFKSLCENKRHEEAVQLLAKLDNPNDKVFAKKILSSIQPLQTRGSKARS